VPKYIDQVETYAASFPTIADFIGSSGIGYSRAGGKYLVVEGGYIRITASGQVLQVLAEGDTSEISGSPVPVSYVVTPSESRIINLESAPILTEYDDPFLNLDIANGKYSASYDDPERGDISDYITCVRTGPLYALQMNGEIKRFASDEAVWGVARGNDTGLIYSNGHRNNVLNSHDPESWTDTNSIVSDSPLSVLGHDLVKLSPTNSAHVITTTSDGPAAWASGDVVPVRVLFLHGKGARFRITLGNTASANSVVVSISEAFITLTTTTMGTVADQTLRSYGLVQELSFYITLTESVAASDMLVSVGTGTDTGYTIFSGVEVGNDAWLNGGSTESGHDIGPIVKTSGSGAAATRGVHSVNQSRLPVCTLTDPIWFEVDGDIRNQSIQLETTDGVKVAEFTTGFGGQSVAVKGGATDLFERVAYEDCGFAPIRGYWNCAPVTGNQRGWMGLSRGGNPIYSEAAFTNHDNGNDEYTFVPNEIYLGGSNSSGDSIITSFKMGRGRVDPKPMQLRDGLYFNHPNVTRGVYTMAVQSKIVSDAGNRPIQFLGDGVFDHMRFAAQEGDEALVDDIGSGKVRSEVYVESNPGFLGNPHSFEFWLSVEDFAVMTGEYPFFVCFQLHAGADDNGAFWSPPVAIMIDKSTGLYSLQTRTTTETALDNNVGEVIEYTWPFNPKEAHHIVLDWIDGGGTADGHLKLTLNGQTVVDEVKPTGYNFGNGCKPNWGVYARTDAVIEGELVSHFMNFKMRRDGGSFVDEPNRTIPISMQKFGIYPADQN